MKKRKINENESTTDHNETVPPLKIRKVKDNNESSEKYVHLIKDRERVAQAIVVKIQKGDNQQVKITKILKGGASENFEVGKTCSWKKIAMVDIQRPFISDDQVYVFKDNDHIADGIVMSEDCLDATKVMVHITQLRHENLNKMKDDLDMSVNAILPWKINDLDFRKELPLKKVKNTKSWKKNQEKNKKITGAAYLDSKGNTVESQILTSEEEVQTCCSNGNSCRSNCAEKFTKSQLMIIREKI